MTKFSAKNRMHFSCFTLSPKFETLINVTRTQSIAKLAGLRVCVDELLYMPALETPPDRRHPFAYYITIENGSDRPVTLRARKWIVAQEQGGTLVVEGLGVIGKTPRLLPGESFSYNSYHAVCANAEVSGSFLLQDDEGNTFAVRVPDYHLEVPFWSI